MMVAILHSQTEQTILGLTPLRIGSASGNQLVLIDVSVEPYHAEIRPSGDGYSIVALSRNSRTFVNKRRLDINAPQALRNGDLVRIGNVELTYEIASSLSTASTIPSSASSGNAGYPPQDLTPDR